MPTSGINSQPLTKPSLRKALRAKRRQLSPQQQTLAATKVSQQLRRQPFYLRSKHLAYYWASDGELSLHYHCVHALALNKHCYLPQINRGKEERMRFLPFDQQTAMINNRFGIPEPDKALVKAKPAWALDVVFLPLVGFDNKGNRLGMGGGYYDRCFSDLSSKPRRPLLIGVGHACQELAKIPTESWDIALDAVVSDEKIYCRDKIARRHFREKDCEIFS